MGLARFVAQDPYDLAATERELEDLLSKARGVIDYAIGQNGDVVVVYDRHQFSDEVLEDALGRLGFRLQHIMDDPNADETQVRHALGHQTLDATSKG